MRQLSLGSTRTLLLAALALAAVVVVASFALMATNSDRPEEATPDIAAPGHLGGGPGPRAAKTKRSDPGDEGPEDTDPDSTEPVEWKRPPGEVTNGRTPFDGGDVFEVTPATLRAELGARHWEEVRRMIDELDAGTGVPADVVKQLMDMLAKDDLRLDAVLALGGVKKDDATGRALAELALSPDATLETRQAALDALAKSGQKAALPMLQQLMASDALDDAIARHAVFALAGVDGPEAAKTLLALESKHAGDDLHNAIVNAIGKMKDADAGMADALRGAAAKGDKDSLQSVLVAAQIQGQAVGPEVRTELQRLVESSTALSAFTDDVERQIVQGTAMPAAVAAGIVEPVLRVATTTGPLRDIALNALRQARGDTPAKLIVAALAHATDDATRRELAVALGETGSTAATPTLVALLDNSGANVRNAAARGLGLIRDPAAVKPILAHLEKAPPDNDFANALVVSLGTIGANEALGTLEKLEKSQEPFWRNLNTFIRNAIVRINTGNPESLLLSSTDKPR